MKRCAVDILREDLFYRLNVFHIHLPPLRDRKEDVISIAESLIQDLNRKHDDARRDLSPASDRSTAEARLAGQCARTTQRPGAGRDPGRRGFRAGAPLACESADTSGGSRGGSGWDARAIVPPQVDPSANEPETVRVPIGTTVEEAEKNLILRTLEHTRNNKTRAAEVLGISLKTLHNKLKEYGAKDTI